MTSQVTLGRFALADGVYGEWNTPKVEWTPKALNNPAPGSP